MTQETALSKKYSDLAVFRQTFLEEAWDAAELTLPFILPRNATYNQTLPTPYQGVGARGINNLTAKLLLMLYSL